MDASETPIDALVARSRDGDTWAFGQIALRFGPAMKTVAQRLGPASSADDIVQESLIQAWQRLDQLADPQAVRPWLLRLTARKAIDHARRTKNHADVDALEHLHATTDSPASAVVASEGTQALVEALAKLPQSQRTVWWLREAADMSYEEIAHTLGISATSVRGRLARARQTLMTEMEEWR